LTITAASQPEAASHAPVLVEDCYAVIAAVCDENLVSAVHRHTTRHRKMTFAKCSYMPPIPHDNNAIIISVYNEKITDAVDRQGLLMEFTHDMTSLNIMRVNYHW
jgi:hypothetical protein